jgi:ABC-2 type transport system ATP-binding protein
MKDDIAIKINHISKTFRVPHEKHNSLKDKAVHIFGPRNFTKSKVLDDISFEVKKGEFFGIVGKNGSGKSTLLKILANIYQPSSGDVQISGSLAPFIELGVGFNPELSGRENVFLSGTILGLTKKKIESIYEDIVAFAEIEEFMDQKLKNYSSGMQVRLAFSIAVRAESDILLIDEVLAVGDAAFQAKCLNYFEELKRKKKTVIFISHDMEAVKQFCDKAVLINNSKLASQGSATLVANDYYKYNASSIIKSTLEDGTNLLKLSILDKDHKESKVFEKPKELIFSLKWKKNNQIKNAGISVFRNDGTYIFGTNTQVDEYNVDNSKVSLNVKNLNLAKGSYILKVIFFGETDRVPVEFIDNAAQFNIDDNDIHQGVVRLKSDWVKHV